MAAPRRVLPLLLLFLLLAGCAVPVARPLPSGALTVLGPTSGFSPTSPPPDWVAEYPARGAPALAVAPVDGVLALRARFPVNGNSAILGRRVSTPLLSTPFLRWGWWMDGAGPQGHGDLPLRLLIMFHGGDPARPSYTAETPRWLGASLPPYDRALSLVWGDATPSVATEANDIVRYPVRTGTAGLRRWSLESVDLAAIYRQLWPGDEIGRARIMFIGVRFAPAARPATGAVAEITLAR